MGTPRSSVSYVTTTTDLGALVQTRRTVAVKVNSMTQEAMAEEAINILRQVVVRPYKTATDVELCRELWRRHSAVEDELDDVHDPFIAFGRLAAHMLVTVAMHISPESDRDNVYDDIWSMVMQGVEDEISAWLSGPRPEPEPEVFVHYNPDGGHPQPRLLKSLHSGWYVIRPGGSLDRYFGPYDSTHAAVARIVFSTADRLEFVNNLD